VPPEEPLQPPETPVGRAEASAPAGSDSDVATAALSAAAVMVPLDSHLGGGGITPAQRLGDAEHQSGGAGREAAAGFAVTRRDHDLWRASARLPRLVVRTEAGGADSPMMAGPSQPSPDHDAPVSICCTHRAPSCTPACH